ncbi:hypothetical protein N665_0017s0102 [Sinapis alba]|nr:hypothetical protein N665_0017s0102 [Sinapis alba]
MATAILSSRNSLNHQFDHESLIHRNPNSRLRRNSTTAPRQLKRSSSKASQSKTLVASPAANTKLVMGQVRILKRGETLSAAFRKDDTKRHRLRMSDVDLMTNRTRPEQETVEKQIGASIGLEIVSVDYAGSCNSVSPPPSSLPIPCFLEKKD